MRPPTFSELQVILLSHLDHTGCDLSDPTHGTLFTDLGADPTDILDIALDLETRYHLDTSIPDDVIETFTTPGAIHRYLEDTLDPSTVRDWRGHCDALSESAARKETAIKEATQAWASYAQGSDSVSDTPRTDSHQLKGQMAYDRLWSDFARQLEREINDLSSALLKARMMLAHINLFISHDDPLYADVVAYFASDSQNAEPSHGPSSGS